MWATTRGIFKKYPLIRGMAAYAMIWPIGSCVQQKLAGKQQLDFARAARFALYGSMYVAPTLYLWVRISSKLWPAVGFKTAIKKALIEQVTYGPFAMASFFSIITLLEGGTIRQAVEEVEKKFFPTYKVGVCVWPVLQTVNFTFVSEKNRVIYVAVCSLMWTSFLAYMKYLEESTQKNRL